MIALIGFALSEAMNVCGLHGWPPIRYSIGPTIMRLSIEPRPKPPPLDALPPPSSTIGSKGLPFCPS